MSDVLDMTTSGDLTSTFVLLGLSPDLAIGLSLTRNGDLLLQEEEEEGVNLDSSGEEVHELDNDGDGVSTLGGGMSTPGLTPTNTAAAAMTLGGYLATL